MWSWLASGAAIILLVSPILAEQQSETGSEAASDDSSGSKERIINRRLYAAHSKEWQYYGMPIESRDARKHARRLEEPVQKFSKVHQVEEFVPTKPTVPITTTTTATTTTTTEATTTPDFRYRRLYNADETASIMDVPYMAAILMNQQVWCGAVLLDRNRLLTAAHCLQLQYNNRFFREYVKMLTVRVGSTNATAGGEEYPVTDIFFHPNYKPDTLQFNFAVIRINKNVTFSDSIQSIKYSSEVIVPVDRTISFTGWGSVWADGGMSGQVLLQKVELPVYDLADCQEVYSRELVTKTNFCAGYITEQKNVCNHDAGGPAVMDGKVIGILSFSNKRCDELDKPAVFSKVGIAAPWIETLNVNKGLGLKFIG